MRLVCHPDTLPALLPAGSSDMSKYLVGAMRCSYCPPCMLGFQNSFPSQLTRVGTPLQLLSCLDFEVTGFPDCSPCPLLRYARAPKSSPFQLRRAGTGPQLLSICLNQNTGFLNCSPCLVLRYALCPRAYLTVV